MPSKLLLNVSLLSAFVAFFLFFTSAAAIILQLEDYGILPDGSTNTLVQLYIFGIVPASLLLSLVSMLLYWRGRYRELYGKVRHTTTFWLSIGFVALWAFLSLAVLFTIDPSAAFLFITVLALGSALYVPLLEHTLREGVEANNPLARLANALFSHRLYR